MKIKTLALCFSLVCYSAAHANLEGFHLVAGDAAPPVQDASGALVITSGKQAVIQWNKFSIDAHEAARFVQADASSAVLNRVMGKEMSALLGKLESNGKIYLINSNGVLIGPDAHIDCAGFLASTLDILDQDFMQGEELLFQGDSLQSVINQGTISTPRGDIYLIAKTVSNEGRLSAPDGDVGLFSTSSVLIKPAEQNKIFIRSALAQETLNQEIKEGASPYSYAISHSGEIEAGALRTEGGRVYLVADAGDTFITGKITAPSGEVRVHASEEITLASSAEIDSSGSRGGQIYIGGEKGGKEGPFFSSKLTTIQEGSQISANGLETDAGEIILWADENICFFGGANARALGVRGDGGFVEISTGNDFHITGPINASSGYGKNGTFLFDPPGPLIVNHSASAGPGTFGDGFINATLGAATNVVLNTALAPAAGAETVTFNNGAGAVVITWATTATFQIIAGQDINMGGAANTNITSTSAASFTAIDWTANGNAAASYNGITFPGTISSVGGNINMTGTGGNGVGNAGISLSGGTITSTGNGQINLTGNGATTGGDGISTSAATLSVVNGNMTLMGTAGANGGGTGIIIIPAGPTITSTGTGSVTLTGIGPSASATGAGNGIQLAGGTSITTSSTGTIFLNGTGGTSTTNVCHGMTLFGTIQSTGTSAAQIQFTGNTLLGAASTSNAIDIQNLSLSTVDANVIMMGTAAGSSFQNHGIRSIGTLTSTGLGSFLLTGIGSPNGTLQNDGILITGGSISCSGTGAATLMGTGGGSLFSNTGVEFETASLSTNSGNISLTGQGSPGTLLNQGVQISTASSLSTVSGQIILNGTGGGGGPDSTGVEITVGGSVTVTGAGSVNITGTSNLASGGGNAAVLIDGTGSQLSSTGPVIITGNKGGNDGSAAIQVSSGAVVSTTGASTLTLTGTSVSPAANSYGILLTDPGSSITTAAGALSLTGSSVPGSAGVLIQEGGIGQSGSTLAVHSLNNDVQVIGSNALAATPSQLSSTSMATYTVVGNLLVQGGNATGSFGQLNSGSTSDFLVNGNLSVLGGGGTNALGQISSTGAPNFAIGGNLLVQGGGSSGATGQITTPSTSNFAVTGGLSVVGGGGSDAFGQISSTGTPTFAIGGNLLVQGGGGPGAFGQIGNSTGTGVSTLQFNTIGGTLTVNGSNQNGYALIGHGALAGGPATLSGNIVLTNVGGSILVQGANAGAGASGFGQIGHLNGGAPSISGDITLSSGQNIIITGGSTGASAYARIGHGGQSGGSFGASTMLLFANFNISLTSAAGQAQIVNPSQAAGSGNLTLVVDNLFPSPPKIGTGKFILNSTLTATGQLRIYTAEQLFNIIHSPINGVIFVPGNLGEDTSTEEFLIYYPGGTYGGALFKFYYKGRGLPVPGSPIFPGKDFFHSIGSAGFSLPVLQFPPFGTADAVSIFAGTIGGACGSGGFTPFASFIFEDRIYYWKDEK